MTAWPDPGAAGGPRRLSQIGIRLPAAAPAMPGTVAVVSRPDRSPLPGARQLACPCPRRGRLPAGGPGLISTAVAGRRLAAAACCDWYVWLATMDATATATPKTASSAIRIAPSIRSTGRLSVLLPASIRLSRDIRPVSTRRTVSDPGYGTADSSEAHRDIAVGLADVPPGSGGGECRAERVVRGVRSPAGY